MQTRQNEAGFTLIGMLIAVGIVAILAMIAVPKFTSAITSANTAKIQSDLSTLDTAIAVYEIDTGKTPGGNRGPEGLSAGYDDSAAEGEMLLRGCSYRDHG